MTKIEKLRKATEKFQQTNQAKDMKKVVVSGVLEGYIAKVSKNGLYATVIMLDGKQVIEPVANITLL